MKKEYYTEGTITFNFSIDTTGLSEEEAEKRALEKLDDFYHLSVGGAPLVKESLSITDVITDYYEEEEED